MPKIVTPNSDAALEFGFNGTSGASNYRLIGLEITTTADFLYRLINIGETNGAVASSIAQLPTNIIIDRLYIHGNGNNQIRSGIMMNSAATAVIDSYISEIYQPGYDSQAIASWNGTGPYKIVNNYLEAASENVIFGGAASPIANLNASDIEIRGNHFFKPLSWENSGLTGKNLLEFKAGLRVLVEGNVFENTFGDAQVGFAIVITPRTSGGANPWMETDDITIRKNKFTSASGINISGRDDADPVLRTKRILIEDNLVTTTGENCGDFRTFQVLNGAIGITIRNNTTFMVPAVNACSGRTAFVAENNPKAVQFDYENNLQQWGDYGFIGSGTNGINSTLKSWFETDAIVTKNVFIGGTMVMYPDTSPTPPSSTNYYPATNVDVGFVDFSGGNYSLAPTSPFKNAGTNGRDIGADLNSLYASIANSASSPGTRVTYPGYNIWMGARRDTDYATGVGSIAISGGVPTCSSWCSPSIAPGTTVTLTETPNSGYSFKGWSYACLGTSPTCSFTINGPKYLEAVFCQTGSAGCP
jgi:hypothetical protein